MKKLFQFTFALTAVILLATGCPFVPDPGTQTYTVITGVYMIDGGTEDSPAMLSSINYSNKSITQDLFGQQNGMSLAGRVPDAISYGSHLCLCAQDARKVYITDLSGKIEHEITAGPSGNYTPLRIIQNNEYLYVAYAEGYLGRIDTTGFNVTLLNLGKKPLGMAVSQEKIYVACPGIDNGTTLAVVEARAFAPYKELTVTANPSQVIANGKTNLYVLSEGTVDGTASSLQLINTEKDEVKLSVNLTAPFKMAEGPDGYIFVLTREKVVETVTQKIVPVDGFTARTVMEDFNQGDVLLQDAVSIDVDPVNGVVFVGSTRDDGSGVYDVLNVRGSLWHSFYTTSTPGKVFFSTAVVEYQY